MPTSPTSEWLTEVRPRLSERLGTPARLSPDALGFVVGDATVTLRVRPADAAPSWMQHGGVAMNVETPSPTPEPVRIFLRALRVAIEALPPAPRPPSATSPSPTSPSPTPPTPTSPRPTRNALHPASPALAAVLNRAAYFALRILEEERRLLPTVLRHDGERTAPWRTMVIEEFYPYMGALGVPLTQDEVLRGWARTVAETRRGAAPEGIDLYVHVPFCATLCRFCYCAVSTDLTGGISDRYVEHLEAEMATFGRALDGLPVRTIFVGGGTPSILSPRLLERLFGSLRERFAVETDAQITVETNPDSLTEEKLRILRTVGGVTRLTMGIQSLDPEAQRRMDRHNDATRIRRMVDAARQLGIPQLNVDIIAGLDGQSIEAFERDVEFALSLAPDSFHLSPFRALEMTSLTPDPEQTERRRQMMSWGRARLREHGLEYRKNLPATLKEDATNEQIHRFHRASSSLLGIGASAYAHSFGGHFYERPFDLAPTLAKIRLRAEPPPYRGLPADGPEELHRFLVHGYFEKEIARAPFRALFGCEPWDAVPEAWAQLEALDAVRVDDAFVRFEIDSYAELVTLRTLLFGPTVLARCEALWAADFDPGTDYVARVETFCRWAD